MYVKKHIHQGRTVLAVCDNDILGKTLKDKEIQLEVNKVFYGGSLTNEKEVSLLLKEFENINLVGKKAVALALKLEIVNKEDVKYIKDVPFVIIFEI